MADRELKVKIGIDLSGLKGDAAAAAREFEGIGKAAQKGSEDAQKSSSKLGDETAKQADKGGSAWAKAGPWIGTAVAAGAGIAVKAIVDLGMTYEQNLNQVQSVTGATNAQMQQLGDTAKALGNDIDLPTASASDAAEAMLELAKGGLSVDEAMRSAKGTLTLAAAAQISGAEAATIQSAALNTFGLSAESAGHVADVLANVANASSGEITDFAQGMAQAGLVANSMGVDVDGAATVLGIFANQGLSGSDAGTSFKTMLVSLQSPSEQAAGALAELGVNAFDAQGKFVGMRAVTEQLSAAQATMTQQQFTAAASTAFGTDAVRAAVAMASQGVAGYDKMAAAVGKAGGAQEVAAAQTKGVTGALNNVKNQLENTALSIYQKYSPALEEMLNAASDALPGVADFFMGTLDVAGDFIGFIANLPEPVLILAGALTAVAVLKDPVSEVFGAIGQKMGEFKTHVEETAAGTAPLGEVLGETGVDAGVLGEALGASSDKAKEIKGTGVAAAGAMTKLGAAAKVAGAGLMAAFGGPIGIAITVLTTVISQVGSAMSDLELPTNNFASAVDEITGKVTALKAIDLISSTQAQGLKDAGISLQEYGAALTGVPGAQELVRQKLAVYTAGQDANSESLSRGIDLMKAMTGDLEGVAGAESIAAEKARALADANTAILMTDIGIGMDEARTKVANTGTAYDATGRAIDGAADSASAARPVLDDINKAWEEGGINSGEMATQIGAVIGRLDELAGRNGDAEAAQRAFNSAAVDYNNLVLDQSLAGDQMAESQAKVAQATADRDEIQNKATSDTYSAEQKTRDLEQANRDITAATVDLAKVQQDQTLSSGQLTEAGEELRAKMLATAQTAVNQAVETGRLGDAHDAAAAAVQTAKDAFIALQPEADRSSGKAQILADTLFGIPDDVATTIIANTLTAQQQIDAFVQSQNQIRERITQTIVTNFVQGSGSQTTVGKAVDEATALVGRGGPGGFTGGSIAGLMAGAAGFALGGSPGRTNIRGAAAPINPYQDNLLAFGTDGRPLKVRSDEWLINGRVSAALGDDIMGGINAGLYDRAFFEKAGTTNTASGVYSTQGVYPSSAAGTGGPSSIQVFLGDRQITDIVRVVVDGTPLSVAKLQATQREAQLV